MAPQDRRGTGAGHGPVEGRGDGRPLGGPRHDGDRQGHAQQIRDGQRQPRARHVLEGRERAVVHLLIPAGLVELHHPHRRRILEVAQGRIDEGQVPVLADAQDGQARGVLLEKCRVARALGLQVGRLSVEAVEGADGHAVEEAVLDEAPEGRGMRGRHAHVLVEVERGDLRPFDRAVVAKRREELVLRGSRGEDHGRAAVALDEPLHVGRDQPGRGGAHLGAVLVDLDREPSAADGARGRGLRLRDALPIRPPSARSAAGRPPAPRSRDATSSPTRRRRSARSRSPRGCAITRSAGNSPRPGSTGVQGKASRACAGRFMSFTWTCRTVLPRARAPVLGLFAELRERVRGVPDDAQAGAARAFEDRARGRALREVAVGLEPDLHPGRPGVVAQRRERLGDQAARRLEVGALLHAVAEHADARRAQGRGHVRDALAPRRAPLRVRPRPRGGRTTGCPRTRRGGRHRSSRARVSGRPLGISSGRAHSASSPSRNRSSMPS